MRKGRCLNIPTADDGQSASSTYLADHRVSAPLLSSSRIHTGRSHHNEVNLDHSFIPFS